MGDIRDASFAICAEERRVDDAMDLAIQLLRTGCVDLDPDRTKRFLALLADMMDPKIKTETVIKFVGAKHCPAPFGGKPLTIAQEVHYLIGTRNDATAKQAVPPPPIDESRAIAMVAEARNMKTDTVRRYFRRYQDALEEPHDG